MWPPRRAETQPASAPTAAGASTPQLSPLSLFPPPPRRTSPSASPSTARSSGAHSGASRAATTWGPANAAYSRSAPQSANMAGRTPPPLPPLATSSSNGSARKVLLKVPNAKASRWSESAQEWQFLALGDFTVYQVGGSGPTSASPSSARTPPPVPLASRPGASTTPTTATATPPPARATPYPSAIGLVVSVRNSEFPLTNSTSVMFEAENTYVLSNGEGYNVSIELETPRNGSHTILDNILRKYTIFNGVAPSLTNGNAGTNDTLSPVARAGGADISPSGSSSGRSSPELRPSDFKGSLLLIDEQTGKILGPLEQSAPSKESSHVTSNEQPNQFSSSDPVVVSFPEKEDGTLGQGAIKISAFDDITSQYGKSESRIVGAAEYVGKGVLFAAEYGANYTSSAARRYKETTKATDTPLVFSQTTKNTAQSVAKGTEHALRYTRTAVGFIAGHAERLGSQAANYGDQGLQKVGLVSKNRDGEKSNSGVRGFLKSSIQAITTVAEAAEKGGKHFLESGRQSTNDVVQHRWGDEARDITDSITAAGSNVVLVYVDARGVMHRALLKRMGKGALKARMQDGREVVLDDSGLGNQHTERNEKGELVIVDEKTNQGYTMTDNDTSADAPPSYATGYQAGNDTNSSQMVQRKPPPPPPSRVD